jgi:hypothetical protein
VETLLGWLIVVVVVSPWLLFFRWAWRRRKVDGWHVRAAWVRRLQGEID